MDRDIKTGRFTSVGPPLTNINIKVAEEFKAQLQSEAQKAGLTLTAYLIRILEERKN